MKIRTVIVDDEPLARARIVRLLEEHEDIKVVGQCRNGCEAIELVSKKQPDLVFLDIQMPDMDGFKVLSKLQLRYQPFIVFATAYDRYALKAFEVHAIDYLLKPFDRERFREAISRAKQQIKLRKTSAFNEKLFHLLQDYQSEQTDHISSFCLKERGRLVTVPVDEIYWIESQGNYVTLHLENSTFLYRATIQSLEQQLNPEHFLRIHRSHIVNLHFVRKVRYLNNNEYLFTFKNGKEVTSSRSYKKKIEVALSHTVLL